AGVAGDGGRVRITMSDRNLFRVFGHITDDDDATLNALLNDSNGTPVRRRLDPRSDRPFPNSTDLDRALAPNLAGIGFARHMRFSHPLTAEGFEFDFWRRSDRIAMEIMGYRADDEIYKDILKFHVHDLTRIGVVWVPRWKWISGLRTETNYRAVRKALAFAESFLNIDALVLVAYDWRETQAEFTWRLELT
ncbi:hypothetical protein K8I61_02985, partial [bacterium]|nr:hypothetical protein [bacterium]